MRGHDGRRIVPPGERPSTSVGIKIGRERPRLRTANAAPRPMAGSLTPHVSVSEMCWGAGRRAIDIAREISPYIDFRSEAETTPIVLSHRFGFSG